MQTKDDHRLHLIHVLHMAYSGEKAAAYAYNAHWKSLKNPDQRAAIKQIEDEEWEHRRIVGQMLEFLTDKPQPWRELMMATIGRTVGCACFLIGWFLPMYFAGRLEHDNVNEYAVAAGHAKALGLTEFACELMRLRDVELRHEQFFHGVIQGHRLLPLLVSIYGWGVTVPQIRQQANKN